MATRTYTRGNLNTLDPRQLAKQIDTALSRTGTTVVVEGLSVAVTHAQLVAGDDATITARIAAYVYDADWETTPEVLNLRGVVATLRQWSDDAEAAVAAWDGQNQTQKNATTKTVVTRLGVLMDRVADLLVTLWRT